ncbi:MAG: hypothetical protein CME06_04100 [Gemmatimonadetes bacterium]|nr:hypothetical protein [Gemmatimonadota bacterium]
MLDLNAPDFLDSVPAVDVIFMGGVLEYLDRAESVLDALSKKARYLFFSYCPRVASQTEADRLGWKNHWTPGEALAIANDLGDGVMSESGFDPSAPKPVHTYFVASRNWWRPELAAAAGPLPKIHDRPVRCPSG